MKDVTGDLVEELSAIYLQDSGQLFNVLTVWSLYIPLSAHPTP